MRYNVLKITTIMPAMLIVMIVTLLMVACPEVKPDPQKSGGGGGHLKPAETGDTPNPDDTTPAETDDTPKTGDTPDDTVVPDTPDVPVAPVLKTLVAPAVVTAPSVAVDIPDEGKITVTATAPSTLGTTDGKPVDAGNIKYALYYARYGHKKDDITIDGGTSIADIAKVMATPADNNAGIVRITGNATLTTTGFVIALSEDTIYRYFIRSIHPDDETKHTDTAARWAFVLNPLKVRVISDTVTSIGKYAFQDNEFTSVTIGNKVESIGEGAFDSNDLMSVTIGNKVESIGEGAFDSNDLMSVTIGNKVESIGGRAFSNNALTSVIIPDSVTSIGKYAFILGKNNLTNVTLSKKLYDAINTAGNLDSIFGSADRLTYKDHDDNPLP